MRSWNLKLEVRYKIFLSSHFDIQLHTSIFPSLNIGISKNSPARDGAWLRSRLTPQRRPLCGKPWVFGGPNSHRTFVTHSGILTPASSSPPYGVAFTTGGTLPYQLAPCARIRINPFGFLCKAQVLEFRRLA